MKMPTPTDWKQGTIQFPRKAKLTRVDQLLWAYFKNQNRDVGEALQDALMEWIEARVDKNPNLLDEDGIVYALVVSLNEDLEGDLFNARDADLSVARVVCDELQDIRISDVDFSDNVKKAAKAKMVNGENGPISLYNLAHAEFLSQEGIGNTVRGQLDRATQAFKAPTTTSPRVKARQVADLVIEHKWAVCENIAVTVVMKAKDKAAVGRFEVIGIPYSGTSGHAIVVAHRAGELAKPETWGDDFFIVDMWYKNLGMQHTAVFEGGGAEGYVESEIRPRLGTAGGLKSMLDTSNWNEIRVFQGRHVTRDMMAPRPFAPVVGRVIE